MDDPPEVQSNGHWRMAVWALRVGYVGLAVAIAGVVVIPMGSTPWVLAVGVIIWLAAAAVTLAGFFWTRHELPAPRPGYWSMRFMLIHDTVHARSLARRVLISFLSGSDFMASTGWRKISNIGRGPLIRANPSHWLGSPQ